MRARRLVWLWPTAPARAAASRSMEQKRTSSRRSRPGGGPPLRLVLRDAASHHRSRQSNTASQAIHQRSSATLEGVARNRPIMQPHIRIARPSCARAMRTRRRSSQRRLRVMIFRHVTVTALFHAPGSHSRSYHISTLKRLTTRSPLITTSLLLIARTRYTRQRGD